MKNKWILSAFLFTFKEEILLFNQNYFDKGINRKGTRCEKWDGLFKREGENLLPMWVADMDFQSPPDIEEALKHRALHGTYGYTEILEDDFSAPIAFWQRRHHIAFMPQDLVMLPCVVTGLKIAVHLFTQPGDKVVLQSPVYGPFANSVLVNGRIVADAPLIKDSRGYYTMNFPLIEKHFQEGSRLMLLCNPHNPVSRIWKREELEKLITLCRHYQVILVSDEIHAEFALEPLSFTSVFHLSNQPEDLIFSLASASKTFNVAGLQQALLFCKNPLLRQKIENHIAEQGIVSGNLFALEGTRVAYNQGDLWLDGLKKYLKQGALLLEVLLKKHCPKAILTPFEGTYLGWIDISAYGSNSQLLPKIKEAGLFVTDGRAFGENTGEGFIRLNIGCPHHHIEKAVTMLEKALT